MKTVKLTKGLVIAVTLGIILYDIIIVMEKTPGDTISAVILGWSQRWRFIPWLVGNLMGHLFVPQRNVTRTWRIAGAVGLGVSTIIIFVFDCFSWWMWVHMGAVFAVGFVAGPLLFPQEKVDEPGISTGDASGGTGDGN